MTFIMTPNNIDSPPALIKYRVAGTVLARECYEPDRGNNKILRTFTHHLFRGSNNTQHYSIVEQLNDGRKRVLPLNTSVKLTHVNDVSMPLYVIESSQHNFRVRKDVIDINDFWFTLLMI